MTQDSRETTVSLDGRYLYADAGARNTIEHQSSEGAVGAATPGASGLSTRSTIR